MLGEPGKLSGEDGTVISAVCGGALAEQHHAGRNHHKGHNQSQRDAHGHHPAEINHRANIAHHQGGKGNNGGQHGVEAGFSHGDHSLGYQLFLVSLWLLGLKFSVAHNQVNAKGQGNNQQQ